MSAKLTSSSLMPMNLWLVSRVFGPAVPVTDSPYPKRSPKFSPDCCHSLICRLRPASRGWDWIQDGGGHTIARAGPDRLTERPTEYRRESFDGIPIDLNCWKSKLRSMRDSPAETSQLKEKRWGLQGSWRKSRRFVLTCASSNGCGERFRHLGSNVVLHH